MFFSRRRTISSQVITLFLINFSTTTTTSTIYFLVDATQQQQQQPPPEHRIIFFRPISHTDQQTSSNSTTNSNNNQVKTESVPTEYDYEYADDDESGMIKFGPDENFVSRTFGFGLKSLSTNVFFFLITERNPSPNLPPQPVLLLLLFLLLFALRRLLPTSGPESHSRAHLPRLLFLCLSLSNFSLCL